MKLQDEQDKVRSWGRGTMNKEIKKIIVDYLLYTALLIGIADILIIIISIVLMCLCTKKVV